MTVAGGTLAGAGVIAGRVILNSGVIQPGSVNSPAQTSNVGTLTVGQLTLNGGSLTFQISPTSNDEIIITGWDQSATNLALRVTALTGINITQTIAGALTTGTYDLINYANANSPTVLTAADFNDLPLHPTSPNGAFFLTLVNNTAGRQIDLLVQSNTSAVWTGAQDQLWNTLTHPLPKNWQNLGGSPSDYSDGLDVSFGDATTSPTPGVAVGFNPAVDGIVMPNSVTFSGTDPTVSYTLSGHGVAPLDAISGSTSLVKTSVGTLTINLGTSNFTGGSTISAGTFVFGTSTTVSGGAITGGPLGTGTINMGGATIADNGTAITIANAVNISGNLIFNGAPGSLTFTNQVPGNSTVITNASPTTTLTVNNTTTFQQGISGSGDALVITGTGTLDLAGANTYNGGTTVNGGTFILDTTGSLASGSNLTVASTATAVNFNNTAPQVLGILQANGVLNLNTATTTSANDLNGASTGAISMATATSNLTVTEGTYAGVITGSGALTKNTGAGSNVLTLSNSGSTYSNGTNLNGGTLTIGASSVITAGNLVSRTSGHRHPHHRRRRHSQRCDVGPNHRQRDGHQRQPHLGRHEPDGEWFGLEYPDADPPRSLPDHYGQQFGHRYFRQRGR